MVSSSLVERGSRGPRFALPVVVAYLALSALAAHAGLGVVSHVLEPSAETSSELPADLEPAAWLGGPELP